MVGGFFFEEAEDGGGADREGAWRWHFEWVLRLDRDEASSCEVEGKRSD